ncbi:50S ribosomal protein L4 [Candidatus Microgenomates bacterium]|nr:50S ribosomal protein L4 [Candidatus Microgenomates bacterium]
MKNALLSQAVRVYLANQRQGTQNAKTRAEISRTRKKLYKQKGTGGARHGDRKAPIFVGGGIAFAPKPRDYSLKLPTKMRQKALDLALKSKKIEKVVLTKVTGKTKELAKLITVNSNTLLITKDHNPKVWQAGRNIAKLTILPKNQLNVYQVLKADKIYAE